MAVLFLFIFCATLHVTLGQTYYVESAPVAPFSCTITQPCRVSDLPGTFTTAATIVFLPATTGTKSTFTLGTTNFLHPSLVISAGVTFNATILKTSSADSITCNSAAFIGKCTLNANNVDSVDLESCNFTNSFLTSLGCGEINVNYCFATALAGSQHFLLTADNITVQSMTMTASTSSVPLLEFDTASTNDANWFIDSFTGNGLTTTGTSSIVLFSSINGENFIATFQQSTLSNLISGGAFHEMRISSSSLTSMPFACQTTYFRMNWIGGSCKNGLYYSNNQNPYASVTSTVQDTVGTNINFNNGAAFLLHSASGWDIVSAYLGSTNYICGATNQAYLAKCSGTVVDTIFSFSGYDNGSISTSSCPHILVNGNLVCPP
jgi:hypothetical protein